MPEKGSQTDEGILEGVQSRRQSNYNVVRNKGRSELLIDKIFFILFYYKHTIIKARVVQLGPSAH